MNEENTPINTKIEENSRQVKPDDSSGIYLRGFLKISDPESDEIIVETGN